MIQQSLNLDDYAAAPSDDDSESLSESEDGDETTFLSTDDDPFDWILGTSDNMMAEQDMLSAEELLGEDFEREAADIGNFWL